MFQCKICPDALDALVWKDDNQRCGVLKTLKFESCQGFTIDVLKLIILSRSEGCIESGIDLRTPTKIERLVVLKCDRIQGTDGNLEWFKSRVATVQWEDSVSV